MTFIVSRTSIWRDNKKPCDEAYLKEIVLIDERTIDDPSKFERQEDRDNWYTDEGCFNHRVENGHIKRDKIVHEWLIDINSLEELLAFREKYGDIILKNYYMETKDNYLEIEIYDDWRE